MNEKAAKRKHRGLWTALILLLLLAALLADSRWRIVTSEYTLELRDLPESFAGFRILQLSDLHGDEFGRDEKTLLAAIRRAEPDLIAITGDLVDEKADLPRVEAMLPELTAVAPCYYVTGNHEWASGCVGELCALLERYGVTVLHNDYRVVEKDGAGLLLGGVEDPNGRADMIRPDQFVQNVRAAYPDACFVLLAHRNYWPEKYPELPVDVILCGHAHGGIVRLPFVGGVLGTDRLLFPRDTEGTIVSGPYTMVVSRGLGNVRGTLRLFNNPELTVTVLQKSEF